jgi:hypothetical protein
MEITISSETSRGRRLFLTDKALVFPPNWETDRVTVTPSIKIAYQKLQLPTSCSCCHQIPSSY